MLSHVRLALPFTLLAVIAAGDEYAIDPATSHVQVHVGKSGVFGFAGHEHEVVASPSGGRIVADPQRLTASSVSVEFRARDFRVTPANEKPSDIPKIQETMESDVLEIERHPDITFTSSTVKGRERAPGHYALDITGTMALHGVRQTLTVPVEVEIQAATLTARGHLTLTHDAFGLKRASGGGGTVRVKNELTIDFTLVGRREMPGKP